MIVCAPAITAVIVALAIAAPGAGGSELSTALGAIALAGSGDRRPRHLTPDGIERFALNRSGRRSGLGCATSERLGRARRALALDEPQAIRWRRLAVALRANRRSQRTGDRRTPVTRRAPTSP